MLPCSLLFTGLAMTSVTWPALAAVAAVKFLRSSGSAWLASNTIYSCMIEPSPHVASSLGGAVYPDTEEINGER